MRYFQLALITLFIAGCDGVNPSYENNFAPPPQPVPVEKPGKCLVDFSQTCWNATIAKVTECLNGLPSGQETFSADRTFCSGDNGKHVAFKNPSTMFVKPFDVNHSKIDFKIYPNSINECFQVTGTANKFQVQVKGTGEKVVFDFTGDEMVFSCVDGQEVSIAADNIDGCEKSLGPNFSAEVPGLSFGTFTENGIEKGWSFRFRGAAGSPDIFRCYYP